MLPAWQHCTCAVLPAWQHCTCAGLLACGAAVIRQCTYCLPSPAAPCSLPRSYINFYGNYRGRPCKFSGWLVKSLDAGAADDLYIAMKVLRDQRKAAGLI